MRCLFINLLISKLNIGHQITKNLLSTCEIFLHIWNLHLWITLDPNLFKHLNYFRVRYGHYSNCATCATYDTSGTNWTMSISQPEIIQMPRKFGYKLIHRCGFQTCNKISHIDKISCYPVSNLVITKLINSHLMEYQKFRKFLLCYS